MTPTIFIGYDEAQSRTYDVCKESILRMSSAPCAVYPLNHRKLRDIGMFKRTWATGEDGIVRDDGDGFPFSTQFSHTRFLTPHFAAYLGVEEERCLFIDSDFVFLQDIVDLFTSVAENVKRNPKTALSVVKHNYVPKNTTKMNNQVQSQYNRKLWSSMMMFELGGMKRGWNPFSMHPSIKMINEVPGGELHRFEHYPDDAIGTIYPGWNAIPGAEEFAGIPGKRPGYDVPVCAYHYTEGAPDMEGYELSPAAEAYHRIARTLPYPH